MVWTVFSWVFVAGLTAINVFIFLKFKKVTEDMMKSVMPGFKFGDLGPMMAQAQKMMQGLGSGSSTSAGAGVSQSAASPFEAQMRAALQAFQQSQKKNR